MAWRARALLCVCMCVAVVAGLAAAAAAEPHRQAPARANTSSEPSAVWSTVEQLTLSDCLAVAVSPDGGWYAVVTEDTTADGHGGYATASTLTLQSADLKQQRILATGSVCCPKFATGSPRPLLCYLAAGHLMCVAFQAGAARAAGEWGAPRQINTTAPPSVGSDGTVLHFEFSPDGARVAFTSPVATPADSSAPRVVGDDVIIDVITGAPSTRSVMCQQSLAADSGERTTAGAAPAALATCWDSLPFAQVGFPGWFISCWPFDSQFSWGPDNAIAFTHTATSFANNVFDSLGTSLLDVGTGASTSLGYGVFQPTFSPAGRLGFTKLAAGDYKWAQTWQLCALAPGATAVASAVCVNTTDEMATIVGWTADEELLYLEQNRTQWRVCAASLASPAPAVRPVDLGVSGGVIGGGFRATTRPIATVGATGGGKNVTYLGFSHETFDASQQGYVAELGPGLRRRRRQDKAVAPKQVTQLNPGSASHTFPNHELRTWKSSDGLEVEGILILPTKLPAPLIVFTHCGPAMAVLETFVGHGTVCARFPVSRLAELGFLVLMPNYRGSTGYGAKYRRSDQADWGGRDYDDVFTGARVLLGDRYASSVSHMGWSYGGYMSALALGTTKARAGLELRAVVTGGTLSDLISHTGTTDISKIIASWAGGYHWDSPQLRQLMVENSGIYHIENATAPTLMFHGVDDPRMPLSQSYQLHYALRDLGVTNRFLVFPGSGHIPGDNLQILRVWDETVAWFQKYV